MFALRCSIAPGTSRRTVSAAGAEQAGGRRVNARDTTDGAAVGLPDGRSAVGDAGRATRSGSRSPDRKITAAATVPATAATTSNALSTLIADRRTLPGGSGGE
ncbi:hypothetical protein DPM19_08680 [Actinomadura craniellae]|uniref:Uncharacterized protein n=1 Tax=Actinomadura craniellae TaxID=2231787 RepID=A0A365H9S3_9ACTN|nr:hypothetical protein DPM19_08680 [Actinomadura craniellae]